MIRPSLTAAALFAGGCAGAVPVAPLSVEPLRDGVAVAAGAKARAAPRLLPEIAAASSTSTAFGNEPGGGTRGIVSGVRFVTYPSGAVVAAPDRFAQAPSATLPLPARLGGGIVFAVGDTLHRAATWTAAAEPLLRGPSVIRGVWPGLDRVYLRFASGGLLAVDARTGAPLEFGALPASPAVTALAAIDGFRAVAIADLLGVVATTDAGATWRPLAVPADAKTLQLAADAVLVTGGKEVFEVRPEGQVTRVLSRGDKTPADALPPTAERSDAVRIFGSPPLTAALTDGVALADGTVLVARDGALGRVRIADGAVVDFARDAFLLRSARCRGIALGARGEAGFVCGEPAGRTHVYRYAPARHGLELALSFAAPRLVLAGDNGAIAVRGPCASLAPAPSNVPGSPAEEVTYCVRDAQGRLREQVLTNANAARVVPLADGTLAVITAPRGDLTGGHLTFAGPSGARSVPLVLEASGDAPKRALSKGTWLEGFEERRPGVLGGWVEHAGTWLGVEIAFDGRGHHGNFIRDLGNVTVSGLYGLGFVAAQRGYETLDGGMTWRAVELPDPAGRKSPSPRGCSAVGCALDGWLRVGWGEPPAAPRPPAHVASVATSPPAPVLDLACDVVSQRAVPLRAPPRQARRVTPTGTLSTFGRGEFTPFYGAPAPALASDEVGTAMDSLELSDHSRHGLVARGYVWGKKGIEWDTSSHWVIRWTTPFASSREIFAAASSKPPPVIVDATRFVASPGPMRSMGSMALAVGDDPRSALLIASRAMPPESVMVTLEDGQAPTEIRRADGEAFGRIEAALRHEGRWFALTESTEPAAPSVILWQIEGAVAREVIRLPRAWSEGTSRPSASLRLARRDAEGLVGIVVEGVAGPTTRGASRFVAAIDPQAGRLISVEALGSTDWGGKPLVACTGDDGGWAVDLPLAGAQVRATVLGKIVPLRAAYGRVRFAANRACVERMTGIYEGGSEDGLRGSGTASATRSLQVGLLIGSERQTLRCGRAERKP